MNTVYSVIENHEDGTQTVIDYRPFLARFAALVAAAEREACAKLCEDGPLPKESTTLTHIPTLVGCAAAIRARGHVNEQAKSLTRSDDMLKESGIKWEVKP